VADLFAGTGTAARAAYATNRQFIGCDEDPVVVDFATESTRDYTRVCTRIFKDEVEKRINKGSNSAPVGSESKSSSSSGSGSSSDGSGDEGEAEWSSPSKKKALETTPLNRVSRPARIPGGLKKTSFIITPDLPTAPSVVRVLDVNFVDVVKENSAAHRIAEGEETDASFYGCEIAPSKFVRAGMGLKAKDKTLKRNTKFRYFGNMHLMEQAHLPNYLSNEEKQRAIDCDCAPADHPKDVLICVASLSCAAGYANHSTDPKRVNCRFVANKNYTGEDPDECPIFLVVNRDILPGEELFVNYGDDYVIDNLQTLTDDDEAAVDEEEVGEDDDYYEDEEDEKESVDPHGDPWQYSATEDIEDDPKFIKKYPKSVIINKQTSKIEAKRSKMNSLQLESERMCAPVTTLVTDTTTILSSPLPPAVVTIESTTLPSTHQDQATSAVVATVNLPTKKKSGLKRQLQDLAAANVAAVHGKRKRT